MMEGTEYDEPSGFDQTRANCKSFSYVIGFMLGTWLPLVACTYETINGR